MNWSGGVGVLFTVVALSLLLMQGALRWGRSTGLFAALPWGLLPALFLAVAYFGALQQLDDPQVKEERQLYQTQVEKMAAQVFPKAEQTEERDELRAEWSRVIEVAPAIVLSLLLGLLAPLAVYLRWQAARAGRLSQPERLGQWTVPWSLIWLILGPLFLIIAQDRALVAVDAVWIHAAWNVLVVGAAVFLFQGLLVMTSKLRSWSKDPGTRAFVFLTLALVCTSFLVGDVRGLLAALLGIGLFEPWMDLRRLHQPPAEKPGRT